MLSVDTDTCSISADCWGDLCEVSCPRPAEQCRLGLQLVQESAKFLSDHFINKRIYTQVGVAWACLVTSVLDMAR